MTKRAAGLIKRTGKSGVTRIYWSAASVTTKVPEFKPKMILLWKGRGEPTESEQSIINSECERWCGVIRGKVAVKEERSRIKTKLGFIYFIKAGGMIKIGYTKNLKERMTTIQVSMPIKIELIGVMEGTQSFERELHHLFREHKERGEWFRDEGRIARFIAAETTIPDNLER